MHRVAQELHVSKELLPYFPKPQLTHSNVVDLKYDYVVSQDEQENCVKLKHVTQLTWQAIQACYPSSPYYPGTQATQFSVAL